MISFVFCYLLLLQRVQITSPSSTRLSSIFIPPPIRHPINVLSSDLSLFELFYSFREFLACARRYNLPLGDFPNVDQYRKMLREVDKSHTLNLTLYRCCLLFAPPLHSSHVFFRILSFITLFLSLFFIAFSFLPLLRFLS